jgi:hypothetical protein
MSDGGVYTYRTYHQLLSHSIQNEGMHVTSYISETSLQVVEDIDQYREPRVHGPIAALFHPRAPCSNLRSGRRTIPRACRISESFARALTVNRQDTNWQWVMGGNQ